MKSAETTKTGRRKLCVFPLVVVAALSSVLADTHNVASGSTKSLSGVTETSRTVKQGDGTLVMSGNNSLLRMQVSSGTLSISGGSTTIGDSTATGINTDTAPFGQAHGTTVIKDGANVTISAGTFVIVNNGTFIVTNATFDATGASGGFMNGFESTDAAEGSRVIIDDGGILKATELRPSGGGTQNNPAMKEIVGVDLNKGGELHIKNFWTDSSVTRYGRINFNGGILYRTVADGRLFNDDTTRVPWKDDLITPTILEGGFYLNTAGNCTVYKSFASGAAQDGGVHLSGKGVLYWRASDSTWNGGTFLESNEGAILALNGAHGDSSLGAVPATPSTNIWITGNLHSLFSENGTVSLHPNRMISIKDGHLFEIGTSGRLVVGGEIHGEIAEGSTYPFNTYLRNRNNGDWNGSVVLDPGEGHTNDIGRLVVKGLLEVTSGVTRVVSSSSSPSEAGSMVYITGDGSATNNVRGHLLVNGGKLWAPQIDTRFMVGVNYGHLEVTNGGKIEGPKTCYVNGYGTPAMVTIADGGEISVNTFQFANGTTSSTVNLNKGGKLTANEFWCNTTSGATINLDGGCIAIPEGTGHVTFGLYGSTIWPLVTAYVKEGGLAFDVPSGRVLWLRFPIQSAAEQDDGFRKTGAGTLVVMTNCVYKGNTTVAGGQVQYRRDNAIPENTLKLETGGNPSFCLYDGTNVTNAEGKVIVEAWTRHTHAAQTLKRIEGAGRVSYSSKVHVTESVAPSVDGLIIFEWACDLNGNLEIAGDANGCGRIAWDRDVMDLTKLTLKVKDFSTFDKEKAKLINGTTGYRLLECPANLYTGKLKLPADWPSNWEVRYTANGAYLRYLKGAQFVIR